MAQKFLTIPAADLDASNLPTTMTNAILHSTTALSGLTTGTEYRSFLLANPSPVFTPAVAFTADTTVTASTGAIITTDVVIGPETYDIYKFLGDGSITFSESGTVEARILGAGGNGGGRNGGGGGAGELLERLIGTTGGINIAASTYDIKVGTHVNDGISEFAGQIAIKGGRGAAFNSTAADGGSGGGGSGDNLPGESIASALGLGHAGALVSGNGTRPGGGGSAEAEAVRGSYNDPGHGAPAYSSEFTGVIEMLAAGGAGAYGNGGSGIGGQGGTTTNAGTQGVDGTGSGGGGGSNDIRTGGRGGDGSVTIRVRK